MIRKLFLLFLLLASSVQADRHASQTPAEPPPEDRWGTLEPVILKNCAELNRSAPCVMIDVTWINPLTEPGDNPFPHDVAHSKPNDQLYVATGQGMRIFDVSDPERPHAFPYWDASAKLRVWTHSDKNFFLTSIATGLGFVVAGGEEKGLFAVDASDPNGGYLYHDDDPFVRDVLVVEAGGTPYAIVLDNVANVHVYDLEAIGAMSECYEAQDDCPGARMGIMAAGRGIGGAIAGTGRYVAHREFSEFTIWDLDGIADGGPVTRLGAMLSARVFGELALWEENGSYFLALAVGDPGGELWVYDVSCIEGSGPCSLGARTTYLTPDASQPVQPLNLDFSRDGDRAHLWLGSSAVAKSVCVPQRHYLFDAADPQHLVDLTPQVPGGYWSWIDEACAGYNRTARRHCVAGSGAIWCANFSTLDSHLDTRPDVPPDTRGVIFSDGFESGDLERWF